METDATVLLNFNNLPPELLNMVFDDMDDIDLARMRSVCCYWRNIIQSGYNTYLEMTNFNWEAYVKHSTASRICLKLKSLQFPVYLAPEFKNFMFRVRILQLTGYIPAYNVVNILKECRKLTSLCINNVTMDDYRTLQEHTLTEDLPRLRLSKLYLGFPYDDYMDREFVALVNHVGRLLQRNCLKELTVCRVFYTENILRWIYADVLNEPKPIGYKNNVIGLILTKQSRSLERITFTDEFGILLSMAKPYITFYRCTTPYFLNHQPQILKSCLISLDILDPPNPEFLQTILQIYEKQSRMKNLVIYYFNQANLDQIESIICKNATTLEEITIRSFEPMQGTYRTFSCKTFATCSKLEKLTLSANFENRKVKLLDFFQLPISLKILSLTGFIPTGPSDWLNVAGTPDHPNLTQMSLSYLPWLLQNETPVVVFEKSTFDWLRNSFSKIRNLTLKAFNPEEILSEWIVNAIGLESVSNPVSSEFLDWCRSGGRGNEIESIAVSHSQSEQTFRITEDVYEIVIRNNLN